MRKLYQLIIISACLLANSKLMGQCTVSITTDKGTELNCNITSVTLYANTNGKGTITYKWTTGQTTQSISVNKAGVDTVIITSTGGAGCKDTAIIKITKDVTVPVVGITAFPETICSGESATLVAFGASTYVWSTGPTGDRITVSPVSTTTYTVTGTAANGCKATSPESSVIVNELPKITSQSTNAQTLCLNESPKPFTVTATGTSPKYQWFSNTKSSNVGGTFLEGATSSSYTPLTTEPGTLYYYCEVSGTCFPPVKTVISGAVTVNEPPVITSQSVGAQTICLNSPAAALSISATGFDLKYQWYSNKVADNNGGTLLPGATSSFYTPLTNAAGILFYYCVVSSGVCSFLSVTTDISGAIKVNPLPSATISGQSVVCQYAPQPKMTFTGLNTITPYSFFYNVNGGPLQSITTTALLNSVDVSVPTDVIADLSYNLVSVTDGNGCNNLQPATQKISINSGPVLLKTLESVCDNTPFNFTLQSNISDGTTYHWEGVDNPDIQNMPRTGDGKFISDQLDNISAIPVDVIYHVTLTNSSLSCVDSQDYTVTVFPTPHLRLTPNVEICDGTTYSFAATSLTPGTTFKWQRDAVPGINDGLAGKSNNGLISEILHNSTPSNITVTYKFSSYANGCSPGTDNVTVVVKPTPVLSNTNLHDNICFGQSVNFTGSSETVGTSYVGKREHIDGIIPDQIKPIEGTNSIVINEQLTNTISGPPVDVKYAITLTGPNGCPNTQYYTVTVYPDLKLSSEKNLNTCNNLPFVYTGTSKTPGLTFQWKRAAIDSINASTGGNGNTNLVNEILTNTGVLTKTVIYDFTLTSPTGCVSHDFVTVSVLPTPLLSNSNETLADTVCNGTGNSGNVNFTSTSNFDVSYSWVRNTAEGISSGDLSSGIGGDIKQTLTNNTDFPVEVSYAITLTDNTSGCKNTQYYRVTVLPKTTLNSPKVFSVCDNALFTYNATSATPGIDFSWKRAAVDSINSGNESQRSDSIISENLHNSGSVPHAVTYFFTLVSQSNKACQSTDDVTVTVNPTPVLTNNADTSICSGTSFDYKGESSSIIEQWSWSRAKVTGIAEDSNGDNTNKITESLTNETAFPVAVTYIFTLTVDNLNQCSNIQYLTVTVNPKPKVNDVPDQYVCTEEQTAIIAFTSSTPGSTFNWLGGNTTIGINMGGTGAIPAFRATINGTTPVTNEISVYATANSCKGDPGTFNIIVNPKPTLASIKPNYVCSGSTDNQITINQNILENVSYSWTSHTNSTSISGYQNQNVPAANNIIRDVLVNNLSNDKGQVFYDIKLTYTSNIACSRDFVDQVVTVLPQPEPPHFTSLNYTTDDVPLTLCAGSENINFNVINPVDGISYSWTSDVNNNKIIIKDKNDPNTVISFKDFSKANITVAATNTVELGGCINTASQPVKQDNTGFVEQKIFFKQPGNLLIYPDNSFDLTDGYQWGYDTILSGRPNPAYGPPTKIPDQVYQFFIPEKRFITTSGNEPILDTMHYAYWILLHNGNGCFSRVYYNGAFVDGRIQYVPPVDSVKLLVFPNPTNGKFKIDLSGNIYGKIDAKIYNSMGQVVFSKNFTKITPAINEDFNTYHLQGGVYFLVLNSSDLKKVVSPIVIQH